MKKIFITAIVVFTVFVIGTHGVLTAESNQSPTGENFIKPDTTETRGLSINTSTLNIQKMSVESEGEKKDIYFLPATNYIIDNIFGGEIEIFIDGNELIARAAYKEGYTIAGWYSDPELTQLICEDEYFSLILSQCPSGMLFYAHFINNDEVPRIVTSPQTGIDDSDTTLLLIGLSLIFTSGIYFVCYKLKIS